MKIHRTIHKILLSIGIALGVVTVGATANAKADQVNADNTTDNIPQTNQNLDNSQVQSENDTLVNQSNYTPYTPTMDANSGSDNSASMPNANQSYDDSQSAPEYSEYHPNSVNNYQSYQSPQDSTRYNKTYFTRQLNHVYKDMLSHNEHRFRSYDLHHKTSSVNTFHARRNNLVNNDRNNHTTRTTNNYPNESYRSVRVHHHHRNWFRDGLSRRNLSARNWISWHESNHRWNVLSYGGVCVGYFQLNPHYLGYRHGHVDLRPKHQVKVADRYVRGRYGNWANAKRFWVMHHWY